MAEGIAAGGAGRAAPITAIIGTAGDRPDDTLRGIGRIAGQRAQRVAIKETPPLPPRPDAESVVGELLAGVTSGGRPPPTTCRSTRTETEALRAELVGAARPAAGARSTTSRVIVLMCHEERPRSFGLIDGARRAPVDVAAELTDSCRGCRSAPRRG